MPLPFLFPVVAVGVRSLSERLKDSAARHPACVVCGQSATQRTTCCKQHLCPGHMQRWLGDPSPCACHR